MNVARVSVRIVGDEIREVKIRTVGPYHWKDLISTLAFSVSEIRGQMEDSGQRSDMICFPLSKISLAALLKRV